MIVNDDIELRLRKTIKVVTVDSTWSRAVPFNWNTHTLRIINIIMIFVIYARISKAQEISQLYFQFLFCVCSLRLLTHSQVKIVLLLWKFLWDFWHTRVIIYDLSSTNSMHPFLKTNEISHMLITSQKWDRLVKE